MIGNRGQGTGDRRSEHGETVVSGAVPGLDERHEKLVALADLLRARNSIDEGIAGLIDRPALPGHIGEFIASLIFDIELEESATNKSSDGRFRSGPLQGRSVNIKLYGKQEGILDLARDEPPDFYLVLTGPRSTAGSSKGATRAMSIDHVYIFESAVLYPKLKVKLGTATSITKELWYEGQLFPVTTTKTLSLSVEQHKLLNLLPGDPIDRAYGALWRPGLPELTNDELVAVIKEAREAHAEEAALDDARIVREFHERNSAQDATAGRHRE